MSEANYKAIIKFWILRNIHYSIITQLVNVTHHYSDLRNVTQIDVELSNERYYAILSILRINTYFLVEPDQPDQDYNGGPNDSDLESDSQLPPQAPLQQAPQQAPPQQQAVDLSISSHFAALEMEVANKTSDSFLKDFQQKWKSQLPAQGHACTICTGNLAIQHISCTYLTPWALPS